MPAGLRDVGIKVANYKSFVEAPQGFDNILPFNIIIGRNNTGKSALVDLLEFIVTRQRKETLRVNDTFASVVLTIPITAQHLDQTVGPNWGDRSRIIGQRLSYRIEPDGKQALHAVPEQLTKLGFSENVLNPIAINNPNPFLGKRFLRLSAERDIKPENTGAPEIDKHGSGATRTIHYIRTSAKEDSSLVERLMLQDLNAIFNPDASFTRIDTRDSGGEWEVYLDEENKGRIPLSRSGSGLKTVVLVLAYLHLLPAIYKGKMSDYLYGFEELENNLHPAIQRRLLKYLQETSSRTDCIFFLTTHSPVEIDYFARHEEAQVLHITHDGQTAHVATITSYQSGSGILDDLDIRASDILQSNGVIWVEAPRDRLYLNRWIEILTEKGLREGAHYQILQYGGKLLAHLDAEEPTQQAERIHILTVNRNAAVVMDSDKRDERTPLRTTAQRIINELNATNGLSWVTAGRTIENYLPSRLLTPVLDHDPGQYEHVVDTIRRATTPALPYDKVKLAQTLTPQLTNADLDTLDLRARITALCDRIKSWNKIR